MAGTGGQAVPQLARPRRPPHARAPERRDLARRQEEEPIPPEPVDVEGLWLSALGAWLDLHGEWDTDPYSDTTIRSILLWDHVAPLGRDQYVRVVYPGYLFPFGHKTSLVKLTERKMKDAAPSVAGLYQRKFLARRPAAPVVRRHRNFPFDELGSHAPRHADTRQRPGSEQALLPEGERRAVQLGPALRSTRSSGPSDSSRL